MQIRNTLHITLAVMLGILLTSAHAEYVPDTIEFPSSPPLVIASQPVLSLAEGGAIEFWVVTDWQDNPGYHPVILANGSADLPTYRISIAANQDALIVQSGQQYGQFSFDFSDGRTHHVALLVFEEQMVAFIDGKLAGAVSLSIQPGPSGPFMVGACADGSAPFIGAVSAVRIWDVPLEPEDIAGFALRDVNNASSSHPNIDNLVALSDFRNSAFSIVDSFVIDESELMTQAEIIEVLGVEEVRAMDLEFAGTEGENDE